MYYDDCKPLPDTPVTERIARNSNNRLGAALSSVYGFWLTRQGAQRSNATDASKDAYTVIVFDGQARVSS
jgi:hypothetical protein